MMAAPMKKGRSKRRKLMPALFMAMISERFANCVVTKRCVVVKIDGHF